MPIADPRRRYEVMVLREGRWLLREWTTDQAEAVARAEELYAEGSAEGVRVVRGRFSQAGRTFETTCFERTKAARRGAPPIRMGAAPEEVGWCEAADALYGAASRRTIARLLRGFLDRHAITPTELLHGHRYIRLLEREDELVNAALHRVAQQQAAARGVNPRERRDALDGFVAAAIKQARELDESRAAPRLGPEGLARLAADVEALATEPQQRLLLLRHALTRHLEDAGDAATKLERVAALAVPDLPQKLLGLVDEFVAGLLGSPTLIQESIGRHSSLGAALASIADLALGRHGGEAPAAPAALAVLARLSANAAVSETRIVLLDRIARELGGERALCREGRDAERGLFDELLGRLTEDRGLIAGGSAMVEAASRRARRLDIVGGIALPRLAAPEAPARLQLLTAAAKTSFALRQQQALATCLVETLERHDGDPQPLLALRDAIAATPLAPALKQAILDRLPRQAATA